MRTLIALAFAVVGAVTTGCAPVAAPAPGADPLTGLWIGTIEVGPGLLALGGASSGQLRAQLEQRGRIVTGVIAAPGLRGTLRLVRDGPDLYGSAEGSTPQGAGGVTFVGAMEGNQIEGKLENSRVRLRRAQ